MGTLVLSTREYQLARQQFTENQRQARLNWERQTEKDPHDAAHDGTYVIKPLYPLAMLDKGIQQYAGKVIHLGAHERKQSSLNASKDHSEMFRFGELTPSFVLLYIFPLLLIFLGYNTFTEEKERQTLRLLLVQGVSVRQLTLGKWLALSLQLLLLSLLFFVTMVVCYAVSKHEIAVSLSDWIGFMGIYFSYAVVFTNLVILVSAKAKSSGISLTISLSLWILITLIIPKLSTNVAGDLHPFPTLQTFRDNINEDQRNGLNGHNFWNEAAQDFQKKVLQEYGVKTIEELPVAYGGLLLAEGEKYESEIYTKHFNALRNQYGKQQNVYRLSSVLSPFMPVRFVSMALARTDYGFQWHYEDEAEKYRVAFNTALNMNIAENAKGIDGYKAKTSLWTAIPQFDYQWQSTKGILKDHLPEYTIIVVWVTFSFLAMVLASSKIVVV